VKWGGLGLCLLVVATWTVSFWTRSRTVSGHGWIFANKKAVGFNTGMVFIATLDNSPGAGRLGLAFPGPMRWWGRWPKAGPVHIEIPLWMPALLAGVPGSIAWGLDRRANRRARRHECQRCGYDRTGISPGALCPECGSAREAA
jgi:hypothetical protein